MIKSIDPIIAHKQNPMINYGFYAVLFIIGYFIFEALYVSFISRGAGLDDAELISNISFWNWGYGGSQPPLYTWIAFGVTKIFGLHFFVLQLLKYILLSTTFLAVYIGLQLLKIRPIIAGSAMLSLFLLPQIGWESQRALIHSVMGTAGSAWSFAAFIWFMQKRSLSSAIILGLCFAAAILGKYNGALFLVALIGAASITPQFKIYLKSRIFALAIFIAMIAMAPALIFIAFHLSSVFDRANKLAVDKTGNFILDRILGLTHFSIAVLSFCALALLVGLIIMAIHTLRAQTTKINRGIAHQDNQRQLKNDIFAKQFIARILLIGLCLVGGMVVLLGITSIKDRWLQPILFLMPVYFTLILANFDRTNKVVKAYGCLGVIFALLVPIVLYFNIATIYNPAKPPQQLLNYKNLQLALQNEGPFSLALADTPQILGNLRLSQPDLKTLHSETPNAAKRLKKPLLVLWAETKDIPIRLLQILQAANISPTSSVVKSIELHYDGVTNQKQTIFYSYIP